MLACSWHINAKYQHRLISYSLNLFEQLNIVEEELGISHCIKR